MLLRTSSAPLARSLFSTNPNKDNFNNTNTNTNTSQNRPSNTHDKNYSTKISFSNGLQHLNSFSSSSFPSNPSVPEFSPKGIKGIQWNTFRRAQSDSNLESLAFDEVCNNNSSRTIIKIESLDMDDQQQTLRTEPSFCIYNSEDSFGEGDLGKKSLIENEGVLESQFSFGGNLMHMIKEDERENEVEDRERGLSRFKDLKIEVQDEDSGSRGGDFGFGMSKSDESGDLDEHYDRMVRENPSSSLVLRNYARYLESKGDLFGAEENYFRATLADPKDGEILSRYAQLLWELHHDYNRASSYFERAVQAAPDDSHVLAAHASFLWQIDEDEEEDHLLKAEAASAVKQNVDFEGEERPPSPRMHLAMGLGIDMVGFGNGTKIESIGAFSNESSTVDEYYRKMVEENPCNPLFLRNYAIFLDQSKGDLHRAEDYYSRAILMDPHDGQMLSLYADLVWRLHHDKDRATSYFERAVQASPEDSNVLGSYAKYLWETEDE